MAQSNYIPITILRKDGYKTMSKNYDAGIPAEEFFKHVIAPHDFKNPLIDNREKHIEGDFSFGSKYIYTVEVKGDYVAFREGRPTGNIPIEISNEANADGKGWFYHCQEDNVHEIVFCCFDEHRERGPLLSIRIPFVLLELFVTAKLDDSVYKARHEKIARDFKTGTSSVNLCISLAELANECGATVASLRMNQDGEIIHIPIPEEIGLKITGVSP